MKDIIKNILSEKLDKTIIRYDDDEIINLEKGLNRLMPKNYDWWKGIYIDSIEYRPLHNHLTIEGTLKVNEQWFSNQFREYFYSSSVPDEISLGDIIGGKVAQTISDSIKTISQIILSVQINSLSWNGITLTYEDEEQITESLESKWNKGNYNYQHGFCHYFAYNIIDKIRERFPNKKVNYFMILANEVDTEYDNDVVQEYLIHVYIQIDDMLLDSNGFTTHDVAWERADEWERVQRQMTPDEYEINVWDEESDEIPEWFFNNSFCNTGRVKKDLEDFLNHPIVKRIFRDK